MYGQGNISYDTPAAAGSSGGTNPPGVTVPFMAFAVDDGQVGSPVNGQTSLKLATLQGESMVDVQLLVIREGIQLLWNTNVAINNIRRYNSGGLGGWTFEGGLFFLSGERYQIFIIGTNPIVQI
jgi:hypothetical protein